MECAAWTRSESADEELVANVQSLRDQLRRTEKSLQSLGEELSRYECVWEREWPVICSVNMFY